MKTVSKIAAGAAAALLAGGLGLNAFAATPTLPPPSATFSTTTPTPWTATQTYTVSPSVSGSPTQTVTATNTYSPVPGTPTMPQPTGQFKVGQLTFATSADCRTVTVTATGFGAEATDLYVNYGTNSGNMDPTTERAGAQFANGAATAVVTLKDNDAPSEVQVIVSGWGSGHEIQYYFESFTPQCGQVAGARPLARPTVSVSVPGCTTVPGSTVPVTFSITNNDAEGIISDYSLTDMLTGDLVALARPANYEGIGIAPGQTGAFTVMLPRGFFGNWLYNYSTGLDVTGHDFGVSVNVEQCVAAVAATVAVDNSTCMKPSFTILNPADGWKAAGTYSYVLTDAAGKKFTGSADLADGASKVVAETLSMAGVATMVVTNPDGTTTTVTADSASCSATSGNLAKTGK